MNALEVEFLPIIEEELVKLLSSKGKTLGHGPKKLHHLCEVIVRFSIALLLTLSWLEQEIGCDQLKDHTSETPQVSTTIIIDSKHDFWSTILSGLNALCEVIVGPTSITQVADLYTDVLIDERSTFVHFRLLCFLGGLFLLPWGPHLTFILFLSHPLNLRFLNQVLLDLRSKVSIDSEHVLFILRIEPQVR